MVFLGLVLFRCTKVEQFGMTLKLGLRVSLDKESFYMNKYVIRTVIGNFRGFGLLELCSNQSANWAS